MRNQRRLILALGLGLLSLASVGGAGAASSATSRFIRFDAAWARVGFAIEYSNSLGTLKFDAIPTARGTIQAGWRRPSGFTTGVEIGLGDRGGSLESATVFRPEGAEVFEMRRMYLDIGLPIGWRRPLGAYFIEGVAIPRASIRLETPWWMASYEHHRVVAGLDPQVTVGRGLWHLLARYQWDLTPAQSHDTSPQPEVTHSETHDRGFSLGLGVELPF